MARGKGRKKSEDGNVLRGKFIEEASSVNEIVNRLNQVHEKLKQVPNQSSEHAEELKSICTELTRERILESTEKKIRLIASCCLLDILRIYAPDVPFSDPELYEIFRMVISQLKGLAVSTCAANEQYFYILESLAQVKSCILIIGLDQHVDRDDDQHIVLLVQLFSCLFSSLQDDHSVQVESHMLTIMQACVVESDNISTELLECILEQLLNSKARAYHLSRELIRTTSEVVQGPLSRYFNQLLVDNSSEASRSEVSEHLHDLIYEIHKIQPSLLLYVLPNVCLQLQVDDFNVRHDAVALLGRLFASSHAEYGNDYMKNFREFLGRFKDQNKDIRVQMIQVCSIILGRKPELRASILKEIRQRLVDPEWEVRSRAVNEICDLAVTNLDFVDRETLIDAGERMKDKKQCIRKEAMTGLAQLYAAHVSNKWTDTEAPECCSKLKWIPSILLKCYAYPELELKLRVLQLLDDIVLPKQQSQETRMTGLIDIVASLDSLEPLNRIFADRQLCQKKVEAYLNAREDQEKMVAVADLFPQMDSLLAMKQLTQVKDMNVFKSLATIVNPSAKADDIKHAKTQVLKSVGSKTRLGLFLKALYRKTAMLTITVDSIPFLLSSNRPGAFVLMETTARAFPMLFLDHLSDLTDLIEDENASVVALKAMSHLAKCKVLTSCPSDVIDLLKEKCLEGTVEEAKFAAETLSLMTSDFQDLCTKLSSSDAFSLDNPNVETVLQAIQTIGKYSPLSLKDSANTILQALYHEWIEQSIPAIETVASILRYVAPVVELEELEAISNGFINFLFDNLQQKRKTKQLRKVSACVLLKLATVPRFDLTMAQWHTMGRVIQESHVDIRRAMVETIQVCAAKHQLSLKYICYLILLATEHDMKIKKQAKTILLNAIKKMRWTNHQLIQQVEMTVAPEYLLPYAIHLIAHVETNETRQGQCLQFVLDVLVSSEADNISFLMQILEMLSSVTAEQPKAMKGLIEQAVTRLKKKIKTQHSLKPYPGTIYLPRQLFEATHGTKENDNASVSSSSSSPVPSASTTRSKRRRTIAVEETPPPTTPEKFNTFRPKRKRRTLDR